MECGECRLCQFVKQLEFHGIQPLISVCSLICDILSVKKNIVICDDEIGVAPNVLTLSYILNVGKDVDDLVSDICPLIHIYETNMVFYREMLKHFHLNLLLLLLHLCRGDEDMMVLFISSVHKKLWVVVFSKLMLIDRFWFCCIEECLEESAQHLACCLFYGGPISFVSFEENRGRKRKGHTFFNICYLCFNLKITKWRARCFNILYDILAHVFFIWFILSFVVLVEQDVQNSHVTSWHECYT